MNADCDNSGSNEASGQADSSSKVDSHTTSNDLSNKSRWLIRIAILITIVFAGWYWVNPPLNQEERELIGRWERITKSPNGAILKKVIKYDTSREWTLNLVGRSPSGDAGEMRVINMNISGKWNLKGGKLTQSLDLPLRYYPQRLYYEIGDRVSGTSGVYNGIEEGRIRFVAPNKLHIQWYDLTTETYEDFEESTWTRID